MAARKRRENESFKKYRKNLKAEEAKIKRYLRGRIFSGRRLRVPRSWKDFI